jgi:hypothetical protein
VAENLLGVPDADPAEEGGELKTTVIYHSADFDGLFCREIARKFLPPDTEFIGWDFGNTPLAPVIPEGETFYVLDLPVDRVFGFDFSKGETIPPAFAASGSLPNVIWIDHHVSSITSHPKEIPGYRIDGVAACRLAWQWFARSDHASKLCRWDCVPSKEDFIDRKVAEPLAVRLAGEYDIWDKRDPRADTFQFGLRSEPIDEYWPTLLSTEGDGRYRGFNVVTRLLGQGELLQRYQREQDASVVKRAFEVQYEGLTFLALNTARCNSLTFESAAQPQHDGLMGFYFNGQEWVVSLYHSPHHKEHDLSVIAVKHGGGGHRGACGFRVAVLPFIQC